MPFALGNRSRRGDDVARMPTHHKLANTSRQGSVCGHTAKENRRTCLNLFLVFLKNAGVQSLHCHLATSLAAARVRGTRRRVVQSQRRSPRAEYCILDVRPSHPLGSELRSALSHEKSHTPELSKSTRPTRNNTIACKFKTESTSPTCQNVTKLALNQQVPGSSPGRRTK